MSEVTSMRILQHFQHSDLKKSLRYKSLLLAKLIFHYYHHLQAPLHFILGDSGIIAGINVSLTHAVLSKSQKLLFHFALDREKVIISLSHFILYSHNYLLKIICASFLFPKNAQTSCWHSHYSPAVLSRQRESWVETHQNTDTVQIPWLETRSAGRGG